MSRACGARPGRSPTGSRYWAPSTTPRRPRRCGRARRAARGVARRPGAAGGALGRGPGAGRRLRLARGGGGGAAGLPGGHRGRPAAGGGRGDPVSAWVLVLFALVVLVMAGFVMLVSVRVR